MLKLKIEGMTCGHCEAAVKRALAGVEGVTRVIHVSRERCEAAVEGEPNVQALLEAVQNEGYDARVSE